MNSQKKKENPHYREEMKTAYLLKYECPFNMNVRFRIIIG